MLESVEETAERYEQKSQLLYKVFFEQEHEHELGTRELLRKPAGMI